MNSATFPDPRRVTQLRDFLDPLVDRFESPDYIDNDPIAIPHAFDSRGDIEVVGLFAALLAWGQRPTILSKLADLSERMDHRPYDFVLNFREDRDMDRLSGFKHRTFNDQDAFWLITNLSRALNESGSIEALFAIRPDDDCIGQGIENFTSTILDRNPRTPSRLRKHVARPSTGSACKRLCMYVRWMCRPGPFDLGLWDSVDRSQLVLPLDVHSGRQARALGLLTRKSNDWPAAIELTENCALLSPKDPTRYDLSLFGIGAYGVDIPEGLRVNLPT